MCQSITFRKKFCPKDGAPENDPKNERNLLEPVYCEKRQKKVQTKKLGWAIGDLIDTKFILNY